MLLIASRPLAIWFGSSGGDIDVGSPYDQAFLGILFFLGLLILTMRRFKFSYLIRENTWLIVFIGYMFISILWSEIPFQSFKRWIRELIAVIMACIILTERDPHHAMQSLFRRTVYILIPFSMLLIKYFPEYGIEYARWSGMLMWKGVTLQKNGLGRLCLIAAFFLIWMLVSRRHDHSKSVEKYQTYFDIIVLIITLWLIKGGDELGAYSATAVASLTTGLATLTSLLWMRKHRINLGVNSLTVIMGLVFVIGIFQLFIGGSSAGSLSATFGRDTTLTGRTEVWAELMPIAMQNPIMGHGFGGFWTSTSRVLYNISEGHSGYLDVILDLGFVGLLMVSLFLLSSIRKAYRELTHDFDWAVLWICFIFMAIIHNITESSFNSFTSHLTAVLLFLAVSSNVAKS